MILDHGIGQNIHYHEDICLSVQLGFQRRARGHGFIFFGLAKFGLKPDDLPVPML
jgi:hypothetical protein